MEEPIFARDAHFSEIRSALLNERCFLLRGAIEPSKISALAECATTAYAKWDRRIESGINRLTAGEQNLFHHGHIPVQELGANSLEIMVNEGYLRDMIESVFSWKESLRCPSAFLLRRILPPCSANKHVTPKVAFHQDEYFARASDPGASVYPLAFTLWVPLVECGENAPGLTVVRRSDLPLVNRPRLGWSFYIWRKYGSHSMWSPHMMPGDVLAFTSRAIHGSYVQLDMTKPRYSLEIRGGIN